MTTTNNNAVKKQLERLGMVPVVVIEDATKATELAHALVAGGLPCAEVTFRTSAAKDAIMAMRRAEPNMLLGAGTILNTKQAQDAIDGGAQFIVSPGINRDVVKFCKQQGVSIIPGCATPTNIELALEFGLDVVKFFPAEQMGGLAVLKAMSAPYGNVQFMPTGGISAQNMESYLKEKRVLACGGSFMVKKELIDRGDFATITRLTQKVVEQILSIQIVGKETGADASYIVATTPSLVRAEFHLQNKGFFTYFENGSLFCSYNKDKEPCMRLIEN